MGTIQQNEARGILNETSMTIHKKEIGAAGFQTVCGQVYHAEHGQLRMVEITQALEESIANECDRCFQEGDKY